VSSETYLLTHLVYCCIVITIIRLHRLHIVHNMQMRPIAAGVTRSMVCLCVGHTGGLCKNVNQSRCRLGGWLLWVQVTMY